MVLPTRKKKNCFIQNYHSFGKCKVQLVCKHLPANFIYYQSNDCIHVEASYKGLPLMLSTNFIQTQSKLAHAPDCQ